MKIKQAVSQLIVTGMLVVFGMCTLTNVRAEILYSNEFWISTNVTGNFYNSRAGGTLANPFDGSSQANFDANMAEFPVNSRAAGKLTVGDLST